MEDRRGKALLELAAQPPDMHVDNIRSRVEVIVPDLLEHHRARHHLPGVPREIFEQVEFARSQRDRAALPDDGAREQVDLEIADRQLGRLPFGAATIDATEDRIDPSGELGEREGFDEIVVGAGVEPVDAVIDRAQRGEDERRRRNARGANRTEHRQPVEARQHAVRYDQVEDTLARQEQPIAAIAAGLDDIARLPQPLGEVGGGRGIVFDDQDLAGHRWHSGRFPHA